MASILTSPANLHGAAAHPLVPRAFPQPAQQRCIWKNEHHAHKHVHPSKSTYGGHGSLWATQELNRILELTSQRPDAWQGVTCTRGTWKSNALGPDRYELEGRIQFHNTTLSQELFLTEVHSSVKLLSAAPLDGAHTSVKLKPRHDLGTSREPPRDSNPRQDGYWSGFILTPDSFTVADLHLNISLDAAYNKSLSALEHLEAAVMTVHYAVYGPHGVTWRRQDIVLPLSFPTGRSEAVAGPLQSQPVVGAGKQSDQRVRAGCTPVQTHLLSHLDDPVSVVQAYAAPLAQPGDTVCVAESALAVMQVRGHSSSCACCRWCCEGQDTRCHLPTGADIRQGHGLPAPCTAAWDVRAPAMPKILNIYCLTCGLSLGWHHTFRPAPVTGAGRPTRSCTDVLMCP